MNNTGERQSEMGRNLRRAREEAGLTQERLADLAGVSSRTIYLFENDKSSIRLDNYLNLLNALGMELHIAPRQPRTQDP